MFVACIQMRSTTDMEHNWSVFETLCRQAAGRNVDLIISPENTLFLGPQFHKVTLAQSIEATDGWAQKCADLAAELNVHLLLGSMAEQYIEDGQPSMHKCFNTSVFFSNEGLILAKYRKIHLFDVNIPGGLCIAESDTIQAGDDVVVVDCALGKIGMSICYDLRFPELYRKMVDAGAQMIAIPSAFTLTTGKDHWHPLLRARAIETQTWVFAPGQWGTHDEEGKRKSYGHSLIIDPWGVVVADAGEGERIAYAEVDLEYVEQVRQSIPVHSHRRI